MSVSPKKANAGDEDGASSLVPTMTDIAMETAFLRSVVDTRPVGPHKHFLVIQLQADLLRRTETLMPIEEIWRRIEDMFDVTALDRMASPDSIPDSPKSLSPLPKSSRLERTNSDSSLSNASRSPSPSAKTSKSAKLINSSYFGTPFTLPYFRLNQSEWKPNVLTAEAMKRQRSRSVASTSTHTDTEKGFMLNEEEVDINGPELKIWHDTIYDGRPTEGVDQAAEEEQWDLAQKQIAERDAVAEQAAAEQAAEKEEKPKPPKRRAGRPSKAQKEKEDTSELSDAAADAAVEVEEEEEAPKTGRGKRANAGKRRRESTAKEESEDEKGVKDVKPKRKRK